MLLHSMEKAYTVTLVVLLAASVYGSGTTLTPAEVIVNVGDNATFECAPSNLQSLPIVSTIDPKTNESEGLVIPNGRFVYENLDAFRRFTWLNASQQDDGRKFFCTFANTESDRSTLYIADDLNITLEGVSPFTVMIGDPLVVSITIEGFPPPNIITWSRDGVTIGNNTVRTVGSTGISLSRVTPDDAGTYTVTAENGFSSDTETFEIVVIFAPAFIMDDDDLSVREGGSATINCSAVAVPADISYTLTNNGANLTLGADNSHTIDPARTQDAGIYTCTATNDVGTSVFNIALKVGPIPGQVSNIRNRTEGDDIIISWDPAEDYGEEIIRYNIVISYNGLEKNLSTDGPTTSITVAKEDLREYFSKDGEVKVTITITAENEIGKGKPVMESATLQLTQSSGARSKLPNLLLSTLLVIFAYLIVF